MSFFVHYEYFGLSAAAAVQELELQGIVVYRCSLASSGETIFIKRVQEGASSFWMELTERQPTALAQLLGHAIESKLPKAHN